MKVVNLLVEIRHSLQHLGKMYEPEESPFHFKPIDTLEDMHDMDELVSRDPSKKKLLVRN